MISKMMSAGALAVVALSLVGVAAQEPGRRQTGTAPPSGVPSVRVAVVDFASVERAAATPGGDAAEQYRRRRLAELDQLRDEIRRLQLRMVEGGATLSAEIRESTIAEIREREAALRKAETQTHSDIEAMTGSSPEAIRLQIRKVAEDRGYQLVLDRGSLSVLFSAASIDLTSVMIDAMRTKGANPVK